MNQINLRYRLMSLLFIALFAIPGSIAFAQTSDAQSKWDTVIVGGWVFDTQAGEFIRNRGIGIRDGRFRTLSLASEANLDSIQNNTTTWIRLDDDRYILPGLVDCHAHYNVRLIKKRREEFQVMPIVYLANGSTVTFSCGEFAPDEMERLRMRIEKGEQIGPHLLNSGPYFGRARPGWRRDITEEEIKSEVDHWAQRGVGGFKAKQIAPNELRALIEQAHRHGLTVTGHLDSGFRNSVNPRDAIDMGIDRIEHFLGGDAMLGTQPAYDTLGGITADMPEYQAIVKKFVQTGTWFDATLTAYGYGSDGDEYNHWYDESSLFTPYVQQLVQQREAAKEKPKDLEMFLKIYQAKRKTIGAYYDAGGKITLGTDHVSDGNYLPGFSAHRELDVLVRAGIPTKDAIRIGTIHGARALKIDKDFGSIEVGKYADFFVVQGNPIENIHNTRNIEKVSTQGRVYSSRELLQSVAGKLGPASADEADAW